MVAIDVAELEEPPGRAGCPVVAGSDPMDPAELRDPFPSYAYARREAPVCYVEKYDFWSVTRRDDVLAVMRDNERFSTRAAFTFELPPEEMRDRMPVYPSSRQLIFLDEPEHGPARKMVQAPFKPRRLRSMSSLLRTNARDLLRPHDPDRRIEFVHEYATPLAIIVIGEIMGVPEADFPMLERVVDGTVRLLSINLSEDENRALAQVQLDYWEYLLGLAEERRSRPGDDFSSVIATYVNEDGTIATLEEVATHLNTILLAGFETSAQMMTYGVKAMLEHRDQWELLQSGRSLLPTAVEECVRYRSILRRFFRVALTDVEVGGVRIPAGAKVAIVLHSANRDESAFPDPDRFDITRKMDNLTFGRGLHFCVGAPLAKLEMSVTLETLLDLAPDIQLVEGQELKYKENIVLDAIEALQVDLGPVPSGHRG